MKIKSFEYIAELLPDGHLSIPDEIRRKFKRISKKKIKVSVEFETKMTGRKQHPAFGIWADRVSEGSSVELAEDLRKKIESRADVTR